MSQSTYGSSSAFECVDSWPTFRRTRCRVALLRDIHEAGRPTLFCGHCSTRRTKALSYPIVGEPRLFLASGGHDAKVEVATRADLPEYSRSSLKSTVCNTCRRPSRFVRSGVISSLPQNLESVHTVEHDLYPFELSTTPQRQQHLPHLPRPPQLPRPPHLPRLPHLTFSWSESQDSISSIVHGALPGAEVAALEITAEMRMRVI